MTLQVMQRYRQHHPAARVAREQEQVRGGAPEAEGGSGTHATTPEERAAAAEEEQRRATFGGGLRGEHRRQRKAAMAQYKGRGAGAEERHARERDKEQRRAKKEKKRRKQAQRDERARLEEQHQALAGAEAEAAAEARKQAASRRTQRQLEAGLETLRGAGRFAGRFTCSAVDIAGAALCGSGWIVAAVCACSAIYREVTGAIACRAGVFGDERDHRLLTMWYSQAKGDVALAVEIGMQYEEHASDQRECELAAQNTESARDPLDATLERVSIQSAVLQTSPASERAGPLASPASALDTARSI